MTEERLKEVLTAHAEWLRTRFSEEVKGCRADLCGANLCSANLCGANLRSANLRDANLCGANLRSANLCSANLRDADLRDADLCGANLRGANLRDADLCSADLRGANLENVRHDERTAMYALACPEKGAFIGYKKAGRFIVELLITGDAKRSSATTRKCRCSKAKVLSITEFDGSQAGRTEVRSNHDSNFIYRVGDTVEVTDYDEDRWNECSTGIHFFITREEAINYV